MRNIGVLGFDEVGRSLTSIIETKHKVYVRDIQPASGKPDLSEVKPLDILHICIPYFDNLIQTVVAVIKEARY